MADRRIGGVLEEIAETRRRSRLLADQSRRLIGRSRELIDQSWGTSALNELVADFRRRVAAVRRELGGDGPLN